MKFNPKEISLCKQVAKRHRKEIKKGDWVQYQGFRYLVEDAWTREDMAPILEAKLVGYSSIVFQSQCIPLWTISDCLEFLREKKLRFTLYACELNEYSMSIIDDKNTIIVDTIGAKTPLEACLKAVLAVLEENKEV